MLRFLWEFLHLQLEDPGVRACPCFSFCVCLVVCVSCAGSFQSVVPFTFSSAGRIEFGRGKIAVVADALKALGCSKPMVRVRLLCVGQPCTWF